MGVFSISLALASYFSGQFAKMITDSFMISVQQNESVFQLVYGRVAMSLIGIAVISSVIFLYFSKWYHGQEKLVSG